MRRPLSGVIRQLVRMFTAKFSVSAPLWKRYSGQRSIVPPAKSARQGAYAVIAPALSETRDESMAEFVSRRCDFVRFSCGCEAFLKNKVGPFVNGVAAMEVPSQVRCPSSWLFRVPGRDLSLTTRSV